MTETSSLEAKRDQLQRRSQRKLQEGSGEPGTASRKRTRSKTAESLAGETNKALSEKENQRKLKEGSDAPLSPSRGSGDAKSPCRDHGVVAPTEPMFKFSDLEERIGGATLVLQNAYQKLFKKYQDLKARQHVGVDQNLGEQSIKEFASASESLIQKYRDEISRLTQQVQEKGIEEMASRSRALEEAYTDCQNDLVMERSRNLELQQELEEALSYILKKETEEPVIPAVEQVKSHPQNSDVGLNMTMGEGDRPQARDSEASLRMGHDGIDKFQPQASPNGHGRNSTGDIIGSRELCGNKLLQDLLQNLIRFTVAVDLNSPKIIFSHDESGFQFKLEQNKISRQVGGNDSLLYQVITPGTFLELGPDWMQSEIVFDIVQVQLFFQRLSAVAACHY